MVFLEDHPRTCKWLGSHPHLQAIHKWRSAIWKACSIWSESGFMKLWTTCKSWRIKDYPDRNRDFKNPLQGSHKTYHFWVLYPTRSGSPHPPGRTIHGSDHQDLAERTLPAVPLERLVPLWSYKKRGCKKSLRLLQPVGSADHWGWF